jgi:lipopolysaccharide/colanic/teichoic acid biosynthesis glycosyltransferase
MIKRLFDIFASAFGLALMSPVIWICMFLIWQQDYHSPFYIAPRAGRFGKIFKMVKLRSMIIGADKSGVDSTSGEDPRITWVGRLIRRYKLDEFSQLWNVLQGDMSLVGPRPNVLREVAIYTEKERHLLDVRPGITDFSSIVFSDEGDILAGSDDPDLKYNQLIRPWKSRLGLLYAEKCTFFVDLQIILLTVIAIVSRQRALNGLQPIFNKLGANQRLMRIALRQDSLLPHPPPGSSQIVTIR